MYRVLRGPKRREFKKAMLNGSVAEFMTELQMKTNRDLFGDGATQELRSYWTLSKAKSEDTCSERFKLESYDLSDLFQMWLVAKKHETDPFLRLVSLPLNVMMYTKEDLDAVPFGQPIILHMDATGPRVRTPQDLKCKRIYYYCIIMKHDIELLPLAHMITSEHGIPNISTFLKLYKFVIESGRT